MGWTWADSSFWQFHRSLDSLRSLGMIWYDVVKRLELADASISVL